MRGLHPRREPLTRPRFARAPSPTRGEGDISDFQFSCFIPVFYKLSPAFSKTGGTANLARWRNSDAVSYRVCRSETIRDVSVVGIGRVVLTSREHKSNC